MCNIVSTTVSTRYLNIFNTLGQLILSKTIIHDNSDIDISNVSPGIYTAQIINKDKIIKQNIIIQ